jgi:hypothetical protein
MRLPLRVYLHATAPPNLPRGLRGLLSPIASMHIKFDFSILYYKGLTWQGSVWTRRSLLYLLGA